jgi:hypothetical protein
MLISRFILSLLPEQFPDFHIQCFRDPEHILILDDFPPIEHIAELLRGVSGFCRHKALLHALAFHDSSDVRCHDCVKHSLHPFRLFLAYIRVILSLQSAGAPEYIERRHRNGYFKNYF